jgi:hypothetical protein
MKDLVKIYRETERLSETKILAADERQLKMRGKTASHLLAASQCSFVVPQPNLTASHTALTAKERRSSMDTN